MWRPWSNPVSAETVPVERELDVGECETQNPQLAGRGYVLSKGQQAAVLAMVKYAKDKGALSPVSDAAKVLGVSRSAIYNVISKDVQSPKKRGRTPGRYKFSRIDEFQWKVIQRTVYKKYEQNEVPTVPSLHRELVANDPHFNYSVRHLRRMLKELGFKFKKLDQRGRIMLTTRILILRDQYLYRVQKMRDEERPLIFLDETWYDSHDVVKKGWRDESVFSTLNTPSSRGKRIIILHAGWVGGWVPGALLIAAKNIKDASADYHQDMDADLFESWFEKQLLPGLASLFPEKQCAIILDNASYHSRLLYKTPSMKMKKDEMIEALQQLEVEIPTSIIEPNKKPRNPTKADLLKMYKDAGVEKEFRVDTLARAKGHQIVRLPPYYCIYNPIELVWAALKKEVRRRNTSPSLSAGVIHLVRNEISNINEELWRKCCAHARNEESKHVSAPNVEPFIISVEDEEGDSYDEEEDLDLGCEHLV